MPSCILLLISSCALFSPQMDSDLSGVLDHMNPPGCAPAPLTHFRSLHAPLTTCKYANTRSPRSAQLSLPAAAANLGCTAEHGRSFEPGHNFTPKMCFSPEGSSTPEATLPPLRGRTRFTVAAGGCGSVQVMISPQRYCPLSAEACESIHREQFPPDQEPSAFLKSAKAKCTKISEKRECGVSVIPGCYSAQRKPFLPSPECCSLLSS